MAHIDVVDVVAVIASTSAIGTTLLFFRWHLAVTIVTEQKTVWLIIIGYSKDKSAVVPATSELLLRVEYACEIALCEQGRMCTILGLCTVVRDAMHRGNVL